MIQIPSILCVALLWGVTNPLIKKGTRDIENIRTGTRLQRLQMELSYLLTNPGYLVPFGLNQLGSILYFITLQDTKLLTIVPVTNSLTFVVTTLTSILLGESWPNKRQFLGMIFIFIGALCCYSDKT